ncbi:MAG: DinB family protein [Fibrobacteres bacterium]|nr:DinB family protein [Fibrobacterota bacterium]
MIDLKDSPFWNNYVKGGDDPADPLAAFKDHAEICGTYFASLPEGRTAYRYAPEKWSVKQVVGHITDANLIFLYRMVSIGRGETKALPGFDENAYVANAAFDSMAWRAVLDGYRAVAQAAACLLSGFDAAAWERPGCANDTRLTAKEMLRVLIGHERHHILTLKERYGLG